MLFRSGVAAQVTHLGDGQLDLDRLAVAAERRDFDPAPKQARFSGSKQTFHPAPVVLPPFGRDDQLLQGTPLRLGFRPAEEGDRGRIPGDHASVGVEGDNGVKIAFTQIAGLVARRILSFVREGQRVSAGERIGLIRFGSRVDVFLPAGTGSRLLLGQRAIAGETIIAELGTDPMMTGTSQ